MVILTILIAKAIIHQAHQLQFSILAEFFIGKMPDRGYDSRVWTLGDLNPEVL